jgi:alkanesulfonate monooxygenase SsuD/methylene tetrahydromethanopterin reductase-like flavin-dependent oxidoreductase (luciferase family)
VSLGVPVVCAETTERAEWLSKPSALSFVRLRQGQPMQLTTPEAAADYHFTPAERELVRHWTAPLIVGDPAAVRQGLGELAERTGADELVITTMIHGHADRLRSYELVAEAFDLEPRAASASGLSGSSGS